LPKSVEDSNRILKRKYSFAHGRVVRALIGDERELRLRILGMDQECCTSIDVGAQQTQPLVRRVPTFHDDVVQLIAQEVFDHSFVAWIDLKEIREHAGGSVSPLQRARLKQAPHGLGGITMLG